MGLPPAKSSRAVLRHSSDRSPGFRRLARHGKFVYLDLAGQELRDLDSLARIRALAIPPAYTDVWISPRADGHLQATGIDTRGRKQYRYHPLWRSERDQTKYHRMVDFARALPALRAVVAHDLARPHWSRDKVTALAVALLEATSIRVGNESYARSNRHFGLTTLGDRHVQVAGTEIRFHFTGKSGVKRNVTLRDQRLARLVRSLLDLPGQELFHYFDRRGRLQRIHSHDVNAYIRTATQGDFSAKDFRTWAGSVRFALSCAELGPASSTRQAKRQALQAVAAVAAHLGNTPTVCRKSYIHPLLFERYLAGETMAAGPSDRLRTGGPGLHPDEERVLAFLVRALKAERRARIANSQGLEQTLRKSLRDRPPDGPRKAQQRDRRRTRSPRSGAAG